MEILAVVKLSHTFGNFRLAWASFWRKIEIYESQKKTAMKKFTLCAIAFLISSITLAKIEKTSYYFKPQSVQLEDASLDAIVKFKYDMRDLDVQLIEINSFSEGVANRSLSTKLSEERADYILNILLLQDEEISINAYGNERFKLNFSPKSWDRIDIYYSVEPQKVRPPVIVNRPISKLPKNQVKTETKKEVSELPALGTDNTPLVLPIEFVGGTADVRESSKIYMEELLTTLSSNEDLNAHIRGHVCCGNKVSISRKRARVVYHFLIENGVDSSRLSFKGYGNTIPLISPERSGKDRSMNRRVDIIFDKGGQVNQLSNL
jgi:outer membrane protein OmpA-like peptidoglycan-associated protein